MSSIHDDGAAASQEPNLSKAVSLGCKRETLTQSLNCVRPNGRKEEQRTRVLASILRLWCAWCANLPKRTVLLRSTLEGHKSCQHMYSYTLLRSGDALRSVSGGFEVSFGSSYASNASVLDEPSSVRCGLQRVRVPYASRTSGAHLLLPCPCIPLYALQNSTRQSIDQSASSAETAPLQRRLTPILTVLLEVGEGVRGRKDLASRERKRERGHLLKKFPKTGEAKLKNKLHLARALERA